ncbi:hypothetical protein BGZ58_006831, partial [Dissophora ornata]
MDELKARRACIGQDEQIHGALWARQDGSPHNSGICLPSINNMQDLLPPHNHQRLEDVEKSTSRFHQVQGLLHGFYGARRIKSMDWGLKKAKKAEMELAIAAILKE